jgi:hypothetical protein
MRQVAIAVLLATLSLTPAAAHAGSVAGVCPDGSAFVVARKAAAPCLRARFVSDPSNLPPLRPQLLPRPYTWTLDQQARDPNNPYNLLEASEKLNAARGGPSPEPQPALPVAATRPRHANGMQPPSFTPGGAASAAPLALGLDENQIRDLVQLVALRQELAPATFTVEDIERDTELLVRLAHARSFEERVLDELGTSDKRVVLFSVRSVRASEFHPNFFLVRDGTTFRPDPENPREVGFVVGDAGPLEAGYLALGYLIVPERFDPREPLEIWWNDRSVATVLRPD